MATAVPSKTAVLHAYRHLFRQGLKVIRYSTPGRYTLRTIMRRSFRSSSEQFDAPRIANTLRFLERATAAANMEHKIVKNILITRYWETTPIGKDSRMLRNLGLFKEEVVLRQSAYEQFNLTLERLNESLGTCLR
ncbi:unnamed protein product [Penicillium pancosmium]